MLCGDDFGTQRGLLISPASFERLFAAKKQKLFDLVHSFGAKVSHHCCGSSRALFPRFIQCGMDALQTVQPQAAGMNPYELKRDFAGKIALHGAVDVQGWLQQARPAAIEAEVNRLMDEVGGGGGFILAQPLPPARHAAGKRADRLPDRCQSPRGDEPVTCGWGTQRQGVSSDQLSKPRCGQETLVERGTSPAACRRERIETQDRRRPRTALAKCLIPILHAPIP